MKMRKVIVWILLVMLALPMQGLAAEEVKADSAAGVVLLKYLNPDANAKPMARMWFPDAAAGADDNDFIAKQINELAAKGFGGVEVAMLADGVKYNNLEGKEYGWGTDNWIKLLKKILTAANAVPGGFQVDATITAHWPPALNTLDPNDEAASKEISYSFTKITEQAMKDGKINLQLPQQKTSVTARSPFESIDAKFFFTDTFIAAAAAKITDATIIPAVPGSAPGEFPPRAASPERTVYTFDYATLTPVTADVSAFGGYAAGIPDEKTAAENGWNYQSDIVDFFGPSPSGTLEAGQKRDADGNRARMADWQNEYQAALNGLKIGDTLNNEEELATGDWVIISTFYRGTGQTIPGGKIMHNGVFVTNYFNDEGTKATTDYWDYMFDKDPELRELMKSNKGYIFEDSIEASSTASYWANTLLEDVDESYAYKDILPIIAASTHLSNSFMGQSIEKAFEFTGDEGISARIYQDYNDFMAGCYSRYRVEGVSKWAKEAVGYGFRSQCYPLPGLDIARSAMVVDVPEGDNSFKGDGLRFEAGVVNIARKPFQTMEAITGPVVNKVTMGDVLTELGQNYSHGVSRAILHGTPYTKTFNGYNSDWPGWLPFGTMFGSSYTYREDYWDDVETETGYMARTQAIIQNGTAKVDVVGLIDKEASFQLSSGNRFQKILDAGYSYNLISEAVLDAPNAFVSNNRLDDAGPAYKALIIDKVKTFSADGMDKVIEYAKSGLPIILCGSEISLVYGSKVGDDAVVADKLNELKAMSNVVAVDGEENVLDALTQLGIAPYARYSQAQLETTMYMDPTDGTYYYYMYNNAHPDNNGMMGDLQGRLYKGEDKAIHHVEVALAGSGVPYKLNAYTGEVSQVGEYHVNSDGTISLIIDRLGGGESIVYAVASGENAVNNFPAAMAYVAEVDRPASDYSIKREGDALYLCSNIPAKYTVTKSDKTAQEVTVEKQMDLVDLSAEQWNLVIDSYGPQYPNASGLAKTPEWNGIDPADSAITTVDFGSQALGDWKDIQATADQLATLGIPDMKNVSGNGYYTLTFKAPDSWDDNTGAYLDVAYGYDQIGQIIVNGKKFTANNASDRVDLGSALKTGENTIVIKLTTALYGRAFVENHMYANTEFDGGMSFGIRVPYVNGLTNVTLTPYSRIPLN